jgi:hydroxypyruvate isomerase
MHGATREAYVANLKLAAAWAAPLGIDIVIEPINTRDMPDYFLTHTSDARDVIAEVGAANLGLQLDLYHRHLVEGDVAGAIAEFLPLARHVQCADPPDRGEPSSRVLDYPALFHAIDEAGYRGWIGCEYKPRGATLAGLTWPTECGVPLA